MTDTIEQKALALLNEVMEERGWTHYEVPRQACSRVEALCRAIEQHEAFRQEVSDRIEACRAAWPGSWAQFSDTLDRFIIAKPDPLVEALAEATGQGKNYIDERDANALRAAIEKRGGRIVWGEG